MSSPNHERLCRFGVVNCYLVEEEDGLTVVDTSLSGSDRQIIAAAGQRTKPITRIVLTHAHTDHVGSLDSLVEKVGEVDVLISVREAKLLAGDKSPEPDEPAGKPKGGFPKVRATPTRLLSAGDSVGSLEVVAAPGHTPGHIALLDRRDGTLFCGDAFTTLGGVAVPSKLNLRFPLPYFATWDKATTLQTATELTAMEPERLAPGHGKVIASPAAAMRGAVSAAS